MLNPGDKGIDLAQYQHPGGAPINYLAVGATGIKFAYIELSDGTGSLNPYAQQDAKGCLSVGIQIGGYHFFRPTENFDEQVADLCKYYTAVGGWTLPLMIDSEVESPDGWATLAKNISDFRSNLITALHVEVGYYVNQNFYNNMAGFPWGAPVWLADPSHPESPSKACLLQQTGEGRVPGIPATVDLDVWRTPYGAPAPTPKKGHPEMFITAQAGAEYLVMGGNAYHLNPSDLTTYTTGPNPVPVYAITADHFTQFNKVG